MTIPQSTLVVVNLFLGIAALCVSALAIALSFWFYSKSSELQRDTAVLLTKLETLMGTAYRDVFSMVKSRWESELQAPRQEQPLSVVAASHPSEERAETVVNRIEAMRRVAKTWEEWFGYEATSAGHVFPALYLANPDIDALQLTNAVRDLVLEGIATSSDGVETTRSSVVKLDQTKLSEFRQRLREALLRTIRPPDKNTP